ncbi:MAG: D-ribose pyranase [Alkaliphilus sp.]|nr:D-ribose pyranase [Alkaliphilus sp.]
MKKGILINSEISYAIAKMGHMDMLTVCDSGLPIPKEVQRIDVAIKEGLPSFIETLNTIIEELIIEEVVIAKETREVSLIIYEKIMETIKNIECRDNVKIKVTEIDHESFKQLTKQSLCIVRTGEYSPYANIILKSGVLF